jgi:hypothetical protein
MKSRMLGNPLVRFCEGWGRNLQEAPHLLDRSIKRSRVRAGDLKIYPFEPSPWRFAPSLSRWERDGN